MLEALFWLSVAFIFYAYAGYPLLLKVFSIFRSRSVRKGPFAPNVSFIITAYNEEKKIEAKIKNTLEQNYPKDKLEIIVASDCSSDKTDQIVRTYQSRGVRLVIAPERKGKENAQKHAVERAAGEILVFSDVGTRLDPNGVKSIVENFNDPAIGCVSSVDCYIDANGRAGGEGVYLQYEMLLRDLESRVNSVVGLTGAFFAARREVCANWSTDLQSDFNTVLNSVKLGLRAVSDPESVGHYRAIRDQRREFQRKVRTVLRGISVFMKSLSLLNPFRYGLFSWQLFSHKLCRWLVPFAVIAVFTSNALLIAGSAFYLLLFILQCGFYVFGLVGLWANLRIAESVGKIPAFFLLANVSILNAWYRYARGERMVSWSPSER